MEGATDTVFRQIITQCGKPDVFITEFTNVEGLLSQGREHVSQRLRFVESERPLIAQIWGTDPNAFYKVAQQLVRLGFDGIDINMGCPERTVVKHGACAALIKNHKLAKEMITAVKEGAGALPVSIKTRLGFAAIQTDTWIKFLLEQKLDALSVHLRTVREMSDVPAHWEEAKKIVALKNKIAPETIIIGNGDINNLSQGRQKARESGVDGVMMGRAVFHNPYVFNARVDYEDMSKEEKIKLLLTHLALFEKTWGDGKSYAPLKRFFKIYISGFDGASELREKLMATENIEDARACLLVL